METKEKATLNKEILKRVTNGESFDQYKYIWSTVWEDDGKWSTQTTYFKIGNKLYCKHIGKSGSYFSDYYFDSDDWSENEVIYEVNEVDYTIARLMEDRKKLKEIIEILKIDDDTRELLEPYINILDYNIGELPQC